MLEIEGVGKRYGTGEREVVALADVSLTVADGEFVALVGRWTMSTAAGSGSTASRLRLSSG